MLGRELKSRFSALKPPLVRDVIKTNQQTAVNNCRGKRDTTFTVGQNVIVRNYSNPNKAGWSPGTVQKKLGPRNYIVMLANENRTIKRHLDQIRNADLACEEEASRNEPGVKSPARAAQVKSENMEDHDEPVSSEPQEEVENQARQMPIRSSKQKAIEAMRKK